MKKLKLNLEQLHNECDVINKSESVAIKGGTDWITDFFNNHGTGSYTSNYWDNNGYWDMSVSNPGNSGSNGFYFDGGINALSDAVFHSGGTNANDVNYNPDDPADDVFTLYYIGDPNSSGGSGSYGDYGGYSDYGGYGDYGSNGGNGMTNAPIMYAMAGNGDGRAALLAATQTNANNGMTLSSNGLRLIMFHEKWVGGDVYTDPNGHKTIGYGHLIKEGESFTHMTRKEALALLAEDTKGAVKDVNRLVTGADLTQTEFDSLVDFDFNVGQGNFAKSTLLKDINAGNFTQVKSDFMQWTDHGAGYAVRRREDDILLFDNGVYQFR